VVRSSLLFAFGALALGGFVFGSLGFGPGPDDPERTTTGPAPEVIALDPAWRLGPRRMFDADVTALLAHRQPSGPLKEDVFVGTGGVGGLYRFDPAASTTARLLVAEGLGDAEEHAICSVNGLAIRDVDDDGDDELIATTCQILPRGRPRVYLWSLHGGRAPEFECFARSPIRSSWSHGLAFAGGSGRFFSAYCGFGEVVEYRHAANRDSAEGFEGAGLAGRVVRTLEASGEQAGAHDLDGDGIDEVIVATGYALGKATIDAYRPAPVGLEDEPILRIDEGGRFANVRFVVGPVGGQGRLALIAWWTSELIGGRAEVVRYRIEGGRVVHRQLIGEGPSGRLWSSDGQVALVDTDGRGGPEVWATGAEGYVWRFDPAKPDLGMKCILQIGASLGPITGFPAQSRRPATLYIGSGRDVIALEAGDPESADRSTSDHPAISEAAE